MNSFISLSKTFIKANGMSQATDKGQKIKIIILSVFSVLFIFLPVILGVGVFVNIMTKTLQPIGMTAFGLELMLYILCLFSIVFGINIVFSEFYFSSDLEYILPLPLRAMQIVGAKFVAVFYMENFMQFALILSCFVGFGLGSKMSIFGWIVSVVGIITIPILALVYCAILSMLIMGVTRFIRNKELIQRISVVIIFIILIVIVASIGSMQTMNIEAAIEKMATGNKNLFNTLSFIFPNVYFFVKAINTSSIGSLAVYIVINIVAIGIMLVVAELLYYRGLVGLSSGVSTKMTRNVDSLLKRNKVCGQGYAYFMKELRTLFRTPTYFTNCVAVNFIWPIFVYAIYKLVGKGISLEQIRTSYRENELSIQLIVVLGIVGIAILITALNSISSNGLSREGKHFQFIKYIPVEYRIQWNVKALVGAMLSFIGICTFYLPFGIYIRLGVQHIIIHIVLVALAIIFVAYMGLYIDSIQPKLIWDDELSSLRENYNTFFSMGIAIVQAVIMCLGGYFVFNKIKISIWWVYVIIGVILLMCNVVIMLITKKSFIKNIEEQEET